MTSDDHSKHALHSCIQSKTLCIYSFKLDGIFDVHTHVRDLYGIYTVVRTTTKNHVGQNIKSNKAFKNCKKKGSVETVLL